MKSFVTIFRSKAFMFTLMIGLFLTSFLIIVAMLLGNQSGNFVIQVENGDVNKSISITDDEEDRVYTNMLTVEGMSGMSNTTPRAFLGGTKYQQQITTLKEISSTLGRQVVGSSGDRESGAFVYTFYIINTGGTAVNVKLNMTFSNVTNELDNAIRVLTYNENDEELHIYQKPDDQKPQGGSYQYYPTVLESFESNTSIYTEKMFISGTSIDGELPKIKYTVIFWIEGQDPECDERLYNGTIKFGLDISVEN